jgi:hypothetical protein
MYNKGTEKVSVEYGDTALFIEPGETIQTDLTESDKEIAKARLERGNLWREDSTDVTL